MLTGNSRFFFYLFIFLPFLNKHLGKHHVWSGTVDESVTKPSKWAEAASIQMMHRLCSWGEPEELQKLIIPSCQRCQSSFARRCICGHGLCRRASRRPPRSLFLCNVWLWVKKGHFLQPDVVVYLLDHTFRDLAFKLFPGTNCIPVKFNFINLFIFFLLHPASTANCIFKLPTFCPTNNFLRRSKSWLTVQKSPTTERKCLAWF